MKRPFVYFSIPIILGIVLHYYVYINMYLILSLFVIAILTGIIGLKLNHSMTLAIMISFLLLGVLLGMFKERNSQLIKYIDKPIEMKGIIEDVKILGEGNGRYVVRINRVIDGEKSVKVTEKVVLKIYGNKEFNLGETLIIRGRLKEPLPNTNPRLFNYRLNLLSNSIYTTVTARDSFVTPLGVNGLSLPFKLRITFINKLERTLDQYLGEENSIIMKSILLGRYSYLDESIIEEFRNLGLVHILAVSGLHIGIISGLFILLFAYIGLNRKLNIILTIGLIWIYGYMIGNPTSVLRANIMFSLLFLSQILAEPYDSINTLFFSLFILIIINPFWIFNIGFQLSFATTFFILFFAGRSSLELRLKDSIITKPLGGIILAQIGLIPFLAYYFNRIPLIGLIANLVLLPIFTISLILCIFLFLFSFIGVNISYSIGLLMNALLKILFTNIKILNNFPILNLKLPSPSIAGILLYYLLVFLLLKIIDIRKFGSRTNKVIVFYLLFLLLANTLSFTFDSNISLDFIDVGQGDCILLKMKEGSYLIDTGGSIFGDFDVGKSVVLPYLEKEGIFRLDGVFVSHFDADHCNSLPYLIDNMGIDRLYFGYEREDNSIYQKIRKGARAKGIPITILEKGDILKLNKNTYIYTLGPTDGMLRRPNVTDNDLSLVLLLDYYNNRILFTGDVEKEGEENIMMSINGGIDFLKVPHHGSKTSSSDRLLKLLEPTKGFISVGRNNSFGHPHKEIIKRYEDNNIEIYRTDELGLVNLSLNKNSYIITPCIKEKWNIRTIVKDYAVKIIYLFIYLVISYKLVNVYRLGKEKRDGIEL